MRLRKILGELYDKEINKTETWFC